MPLKVNGIPIGEAQIREEAGAMRPHMFEAMAGQSPVEIELRLREWAIQNAVEKVLLQQAALSDPDPIAPEHIDEILRRAEAPADASEAERFQIELQLRIERLIMRQAGSKIGKPKPKEVTEYYRRHRAKLMVPEMVHAGHILKLVKEESEEAGALAAIQAVEAELRQGILFEGLARQSSDDAEHADLGWFSRGQMVPEFERVVFALTPGQTSGIFRTAFGFHIAKLYEHSPSRPAKLEEAQQEIERAIMSERRQRALNRLLAQLREQAVIEQT